MKSLVYSALLFTSLSLLAACSNGDYIANPSTNANSSVNPLDPLTASDFNWSGKEPISANVNGTAFQATSYTYAFDSGMISLFGYNGSKVMMLYMKNTYKDNLYSMGFHQYNSSGAYTDSFGLVSSYYTSVLGNSGGVYITENDSVKFKGLFYFQGINTHGDVINITNGYFNVDKY